MPAGKVTTVFCRCICFAGLQMNTNYAIKIRKCSAKKILLNAHEKMFLEYDKSW